MSVDSSGIHLQGGNPPVAVVGGIPLASQPPSSPQVPANAESPVWQPWVTVQQNALSKFKTEIDAALKVFNQQMNDAQRILDTAEMTAKTLAGTMESAATAAYERYITEAKTLYNSVMAPAIQAYNTATAAAHSQMWRRLTPAERAYAQVAHDAVWTQGLATGGATLGTAAPLPGQ